MEFVVQSNTNLLLTLIIALFLATFVSSQFHFDNYFCVDDVGNYTNYSKYQFNLNLLLSNLQHHAHFTYFNNITVGLGIEQAYGLYMCRGDLNAQQCRDCVKAASSTIIKRCPIQKEAIVWYKECMVRYANRTIFSVAEHYPLAWSRSTANATNPEKFSLVVTETFNGIIEQAAYNKSMTGYATEKVGLNNASETVYCHVQCTPDILGSPCERCLNVALTKTELCCGTARLDKKVFLPSCWLRYDHQPFLHGRDSLSVVGTPSRSSLPSPPPKPI
ncbi:Cysteine-rich repeat secretory protein 9 [Bienertia sinuspersici]